MLPLLRNISQSAIPDPFAFLEYHNVSVLYRLSFPFNETVAYHFDPVASWSFDPALTYLDAIVSKRVLETDWTIGLMSLEDLLARGFTIQQYHPLDTLERRRADVEQFTDRKWNCFSTGPLVGLNIGCVFGNPIISIVGV